MPFTPFHLEPGTAIKAVAAMVGKPLFGGLLRVWNNTAGKGKLGAIEIYSFIAGH